MTGFQVTGQNIWVVLLWWLLCSPPCQANENQTATPSWFAYQQIEHDGLVLRGTVKFTNRVVQCLDLLARKDPNGYRFVKKYMGEIKQHKVSGMVADADPPRFEMSNRLAFSSLTWCASSLAHDAYHSYLYQKHKPADGTATKAHFWAGIKAESLSILYQRSVAKKIDSPKSEIDYLYQLKGTHADMDGDGSITHADEERRTW